MRFYKGSRSWQQLDSPSAFWSIPETTSRAPTMPWRFTTPAVGPMPLGLLNTKSLARVSSLRWPRPQADVAGHASSDGVVDCRDGNARLPHCLVRHAESHGDGGHRLIPDGGVQFRARDAVDSMA